VKKKTFFCLLLPLVLLNISGCVPLIVGSAVGALGGYAVSKDTIQGDADKPYELLWNSAVTVAGYRGTIKEESAAGGYIELEAESSRVWVRLIRLTRATSRLRVSARRHHLPNVALAQDIFVKIMEEAK
jgi:hypothetical protein